MGWKLTRISWKRLSLCWESESFLSVCRRLCPGDSSKERQSGGLFSTKPAVLLADEPTGNLDSYDQHMEVMGLLKSCAARFHQTVLVVTHQEEIAQMADRLLRIEDGRIVYTGQNGCAGQKGGHTCKEEA